MILFFTAQEQDLAPGKIMFLMEITGQPGTVSLCSIFCDPVVMGICFVILNRYQIKKETKKMPKHLHCV